MDISTIPPKPPDIHKEEKETTLPKNSPISYKDKLIRGEGDMDIIIDTNDSVSNILPSATLDKPSKGPLTSTKKRISLSQEDRARMYLLGNTLYNY